jgi:hypothetical protein
VAPLDISELCTVKIDIFSGQQSLYSNNMFFQLLRNIFDEEYNYQEVMLVLIRNFELHLGYIFSRSIN